MSVFFAAGPLAAETVWVKTPNTLIKESQSASSPAIAELERGTPLDLLEKDGKWYRVRLPDGKRGWVFRFKVTEEKPEDQEELFDSLAGLFQEPTVEEASSSASIRGLSKVSENYARRRKTSPEDIKSVREMEKFAVAPDEIDHFLKEGKLGEYGQ